MTVSRTNATDGPYVADWAVTDFPFTFQAMDPSHVGVTIDGVIQTSGFTVALNAGGLGGTVVFDLPPFSGLVVPFANPPFEQQVAFTNSSAFLPEALDTALDQGALRDIYLRNLAENAAVGSPDGPLALARAAELAAQASAASAAASLLALLSGSVAVGVAVPRVSPEMYAETKPSGVCGDGTDDSPAINAAGAAINALGRGAIDFYPGRTYTVGGGQVLSPGHQAVGYAFPPLFNYTLDINGCTGPVAINLNAAKIKCASGVKYGTFNDDGTNKGTVSPALGGGLATPYKAMIRVDNCTGQVTIRNGELDGNIANAVIGGEYDVAGRQIEYSGLLLTNNATAPIIEGVKSHHHGLDDITINGPGIVNVLENGVVRNCDFLSGGRGNAMVGGNGWLFENCRFNKSGKDIGSMGYTGTGAGLDAEASGGRWVKNLTFIRCEFVDNTAMGINAPVDTSNFASHFTFIDCIFIGTTSVTAWVQAPYVRYEGCLFVGTTLGMLASVSNPASAAKFSKCIFAYDHTLSPTGVVYTYGGPTTAHFDWTFGSDGIEFDRCHLIHNEATGSVVSGTSTVRWYNCTFSNLSTGGLQVFGSFEGQNTLFHNVSTHPDPAFGAAHPAYGNWAGMAFDSYRWESDLAGTGGPFALARYEATGDKETGKRIYAGTATYDPPSLTNGSKSPVQTMTVTGAALGDYVDELSFSQNLNGVQLRGWISATDTLSYYFINELAAGTVDLASGTVRAKVRQV